MPNGIPLSELNAYHVSTAIKKGPARAQKTAPAQTSVARLNFPSSGSCLETTAQAKHDLAVKGAPRIRTIAKRRVPIVEQGLGEILNVEKAADGLRKGVAGFHWLRDLGSNLGALCEKRFSSESMIDAG